MGAGLSMTVMIFLRLVESRHGRCISRFRCSGRMAVVSPLDSCLVAFC